MRFIVRYRYIRRRLNILHHNLATYYYSAALFIAITGILILFLDAYKSQNIWGNWEAAFGNAYSYCELDRGPCSVRQPVNTWSNLGFLIVGLISLTFGINDFCQKKIQYTEPYCQVSCFFHHARNLLYLCILRKLLLSCFTDVFFPENGHNRNLCYDDHHTSIQHLCAVSEDEIQGQGIRFASPHYSTSITHLPDFLSLCLETEYKFPIPGNSPGYICI